MSDNVLLMINLCQLSSFLHCVLNYQACSICPYVYVLVLFVTSDTFFFFHSVPGNVRSSTGGKVTEMNVILLLSYIILMMRKATVI